MNHVYKYIMFSLGQDIRRFIINGILSNEKKIGILPSFFLFPLFLFHKFFFFAI